MISFRDIPNIISLLRMGLVFPVIYFLLEEHYAEALILFVVAGLSDGLDGFLARRFDWRSRLGSILDPLADKLLMISVYFCLGWQGLVPVWFVALVLGRDMLIVLGGVAYHYCIGHFSLTPSLISKLNTAGQLLLIFVLLLAQTRVNVPEWFVEGMFWTVVATTALSGVNYVLVWGHRALKNGKEYKAHD